MDRERWLEYLRKRGGTQAAANLLYDSIVHANREAALLNITNLLVAYGDRILELHAQQNRWHPQQGG